MPAVPSAPSSRSPRSTGRQTPISGRGILFVDDDERSSRVLISSLQRRKIPLECTAASNAEQALDLVRGGEFDAAVLDLSIDDHVGPESGLALLQDILALRPHLRVIVLTGHGSDEWGIRALDAGACSFVQKPVQANHLVALLSDAVDHAALRRRYDELRARDQAASFGELRSSSAAMKNVLAQLCFAASNRQPVLLVGETGTGKGVIAHALHRARQHGGPFIRFAPAFGSGDLVSSELFGHQRGAFTGALENRRGLLEESHGGTLFLDEIDELPHETQIMLLNALQEGVFRRLGSNREQRSDFALISATNRPLRSILKEKKLRDDFFHRIAHTVIEIPPLRDRREDIPALAESIAERVITKERLQVAGFAPVALTQLQRYSWPGNVRELQAKVESAVLRAHYHKRRFVELADLMLDTASSREVSGGLCFRDRMHRLEGQLILEALRNHDFNQTKAAAALQLDRVSFRRIMKREGI